MSNYAYVIDSRKPTVYPKIDGWDEDIVETAGFIPLAVRFKQMEQAGYRARFSESEFTSKDISDMYLNHPEFDITCEDDLEEAMEKVMMRNEYIKQVQKEIKKRNSALNQEEDISETDVDLSERIAKAKKDESSEDGDSK